MVVAVNDGALRVRWPRACFHSLAAIRHHPYVRVLAREPLRTRAVRGEHDVEPGLQSMLFGEVDHEIEVVEFILAWAGFHPIPVGMAAYDPKAGRGDSCKVLVPAVPLRRRPAVVLDPDGKRRIRMAEVLGVAHARLSHPATLWDVAGASAVRMSGSNTVLTCVVGASVAATRWPSLTMARIRS